MYVFIFFLLEIAVASSTHLSCLQIVWAILECRGGSDRAVEGQIQVKVLLLLTWLHLAQSMGRAHEFLLAEEGIGSVSLGTLTLLFSTL